MISADLMATPFGRIALVCIIAVLAIAGVTWFSLDQPYLEISLEHGSDLTISSRVGSIVLEPRDLTAEPSEFIDDNIIRRFYQRQDRLAKIIAEDEITLETAGQRRVVSPRPRTLSDLPLIYWAQILTAIGSLAISGWVWSLRPRDLPSVLFALSGLSLCISALAAAIYSTRVLALPEHLFRSLNAINLIGAYGFGIAMLCLFLIYPTRLKGWRILLPGTVIMFLAWGTVATLSLLNILLFLPAAYGPNLIMLSEMIAICFAIAAQYFANRQKPAEKAVLIWFGLSVMIGAGAFIALTATPMIFGSDAFILEQGYAFLFFLIIYVGLAAGLRRYRLFDIGEWGFRIVFYMAGIFLLVALDALLVFILSLDRFPALGISLLLVGFLYLPLRDLLWRRLVNRSPLKEHELFHEVIDVAFETTEDKRADRWITLVRRIFAPLEWHEREQTADVPMLKEDGLALEIPAIAGLPGLYLRYPWNGRSLFGTSHLNLAQQLFQLMTHVENSRGDYEKGVAEERQRIARDMHDNIGAQLMSALHNRDSSRKDAMIRETLTDLRDIINDHSRPVLTYEEALADLRLEASERLAAAGIELDWFIDVEGTLLVNPRIVHGLRSIIREAISNILKHSGARKVSVALNFSDTGYSVKISDDGTGLSQIPGKGGNGLENMHTRVTALGGILEFPETKSGVTLHIKLPPLLERLSL
ncbi:ATP-binding protein [Emcibacter nanhaiensis]|uniref:Histidine kinase n=1 Tax=Emcibacter nanhaiensis TaxID=1505037 RepID=A0A501P9Y9_9PROT|nr:ATP-binding protein [Emcibacter nanhaiensis]TPD56827.1 histidine kinase [Emcibacter nanhaiensis]